MKRGPKKGDYIAVHDFIPFRRTIRAVSNCKDNWENLIASMEGWKKPDELERSWLIAALNFIHLHWGEMTAIQECVSIIFSKRKKIGELKTLSSFQEIRKEWEDFDKLLSRLKLCRSTKEIVTLLGAEEKGMDLMARSWSHRLRAMWHNFYQKLRKSAYSLVTEMMSTPEEDLESNVPIPSMEEVVDFMATESI